MSERTISAVTLLRRRQVEARTGLSRSSIYKMISEGRFPRSIPLGPKAVAWVDHQIDEWIAEQIERATTP